MSVANVTCSGCRREYETGLGNVGHQACPECPGTLQITQGVTRWAPRATTAPGADLAAVIGRVAADPRFPFRAPPARGALGFTWRMQRGFDRAEDTGLLWRWAGDHWRPDVVDGASGGVLLDLVDHLGQAGFVALLENMPAGRARGEAAIRAIAAVWGLE